MADQIAQVDALARAVANLDTKVSNVLPKMQDLISPTTSRTSGSNNAMQNALASFSGGGSSAGGIAGGISNIVGGAMQIGAAAVTYGTMAMPDVTATTSRSAAFYRSALTSPGTSRSGISQATFSAMKGGISSPGSDAAVANYLTNSGVAFSKDPNSEYMRTTRNIANSAKYLGQDNMTAAAAITGLTSGQTSANLMNTLGIYTGDAKGNARSESDIFKDIAGVLTAGQSKMSAEEIQNSYRRGNLGASLNNMGLDKNQQDRFVQFMINQSTGKGMDLSNNAEAKKLMGKNNKLGNSNPIQSTLDINTTMTDQMEAASAPYEKGMADAAGLFQSMNGHVKDLIATFGVLNAQVQTYTSTPVGAAQVTAGSQALAGVGKMLTGIMDIASAGLGPLVNGSKNELGLGSTSDPGSKSGLSSTHVPSTGPVVARKGQKGPMWGAAGHNGTDYSVPDGSPIYAVADGKVATDSVGSGSRSYGHYITLDHGNGYKTLYAHLDPSSADVHPGDVVKAGQVIGKSGHSGHVTGPHLHFEVLKDGVSVTPDAFLTGGVEIDPPQGASTTTTTGGLETSIATLSGTSFSNVFGSGSSSLSATSSVPSWSSANAGGASSTSAPTEITAGGIGGPSSGVAMGGFSGGGSRSRSRSGNNVEINLHIAQASENEAHKFAAMVKRILEDEKLTSNMGSY